MGELRMKLRLKMGSIQCDVGMISPEQANEGQVYDWLVNGN